MNVAIETTLVRARSRVTAGLLALAGVLGSGSVTAQEVTYAEVDRAVVRVLALDTPDVVEVAHHGQKYKFGVPGAGHGSGTVLTKEGLVLTAEHVVSGARAVAVLVPGAETAVTARVLFADKQRDYALLQIAGEQPHVATLCEDGKAFSVREEVFALGYPLDSARNEPQSSRGVVSGKMADGDLQLDMSVNPGNSGGPVIAKGDQVCGIVIERSDPDQGAIGIVKAVPMAAMRDKIEQWRDADPSREPERDADQGIATLLTMLANTGSGWFEASLESSGSQDDQNDEVEALARQYPKSADVQLLTAVYLWNRHTIRKATGRQLRGLSERAIQHAERAVKADPSLRKSSPFVQYLLDDDARDRDGGSAARYHDGFFARVGVGLSYADWKENSSRWAVPAEVLVGGGGSYTFGLVLGFHEGLGTGQASDTNPGTNLSGFGFGGFLQYHPLRDGGLAIQSRVLLMNNTFAAGGGVGERNRTGFAAGIGAGYEWWIAKQLAAGATTMVTFFSDRSGMVPIPSAGVTVTYH